MQDIRSPGRLYRAGAWGAVFALASLLAPAGGCGGPAPGEGMEHPMAEKTPPAIVSAAEALQSPDISEIDPATLDEAEIEKVIPPGPRCDFAYTAGSPPILAAGIGADAATQGVIKIHGRLVKMTAHEITGFESLLSGGTFLADSIKLVIKPELQAGASRNGARRRPANAHFSIGEELHVGYNGWYDCRER